MFSRLRKREHSGQAAPQAAHCTETTATDVSLIEGVFAALATPRRPNSTEADAAVLLEYLDKVTAAGVNGLVLFGATGEFIHFDVEERMRVAALAIRRSRIPVLVNVSHSSLAGAVDLADDACNIGAAGLLVMPPYFYRYNDDQIGEFYREFLRAVEPRIPVLLYNLPAYTNALAPALAAQLLSTPGISGIKDSSGDWDFFQSLLSLRATRRFALMAGHERLYARARSACADGIVSGISAAVPELLVAMDRAIGARSKDRLEYLNVRLDELLHWIERFPATVAIKMAAIARGWFPEQFALPFDSRTAEELAQFRDWFGQWLPAVIVESKGTVGRA